MKSKRLLKPMKNVIEKVFMIPNKAGEIVPFTLNEVQLKFELERTGLDDVVKFRQGGFTSYVMAWFLVECMAGYQQAVMLAHDREHTVRLLERAKLLLTLMRTPPPILSTDNASQLVFPKTHSSFYIGTAGARKFGRSATITLLHCSEVAFWPDPKTLMAGLLQSVPHDSGIIIKESTANGYGTYHHQQYLSALKGTSRFKAHFFPWHMFAEYKTPPPEGFTPTEEEIELANQFHLNSEQLQWRREKISEFNDDVNLFHQEYPSTIEEAFLVSGGALFQEVTLALGKTLQRRMLPESGVRFLCLPGHPVEGYHYSIGIDNSGGTGNDFSVAQVLCVETLEQVGVFKANTIPPPTFGKIVGELGMLFNTAFLIPESNSHGLSVIDTLKTDTGYKDFLYRIYRATVPAKAPQDPLRKVTQYGWSTTRMSKFRLVGTLQTMLARLKLYDGITVDELRGFNETDTGGLEATEGGHDDHVIALALACEGLLKERRFLPLESETEASPKPKAPPSRGFVMTFEEIMQGLTERSQGEYFKPQHKSAPGTPSWS